MLCWVGASVCNGWRDQIRSDHLSCFSRFVWFHLLSLLACSSSCDFDKNKWWHWINCPPKVLLSQNFYNVHCQTGHSGKPSWAVPGYNTGVFEALKYRGWCFVTCERCLGSAEKYHLKWLMFLAERRPHSQMPNDILRWNGAIFRV